MCLSYLVCILYSSECSLTCFICRLWVTKLLLSDENVVGQLAKIYVALNYLRNKVWVVWAILKST